MATRVDIDRISQALSDPRRVEILDLLAAEERSQTCSPENPDAPGALCACDLRPALGDIAPSKLAYHLKQLRESGLVHERPRGKWVYYTLDRATLERYARAVTERWGTSSQAAGTPALAAAPPASRGARATPSATAADRRSKPTRAGGRAEAARKSWAPWEED